MILNNLCGMTEKCEMVCCSLVKNYCKMLHIGDKLYFSTW